MLDRIAVGLPSLKVILGFSEDHASRLDAIKSRACIAWHYWGIIQKVKQAAAVSGERGLLLGSLDDGSEMQIVCLFQLLTSLAEGSNQSSAQLPPDRLISHDNLLCS